ncbi:MAG: serine aminopeptidase domain-containing protein [Isosphaeraceae bacterium]
MSWLTTLLVDPIYRFFYGRLPDKDGAATLNGRGGANGGPRGLVLVADGIGGLDLCGTGLRYVADAERLPADVEVVPWGHGFGRWFADLTNEANRDRQATLLAGAVRRFHADRPEDPVFLVGKSGGSGVVVKALEQLDPDSVERVVLLAPALSPRYDLTVALRAVRREVVVFWSPFDVVILGAGTRVFGTIDRVWSVGAGLVGFVVPPPDDQDGEKLRQYAKLRQVRWRPGMALAGYLGGHAGPDNPMFLRKYVVPLLRAGDAQTVQI